MNLAVEIARTGKTTWLIDGDPTMVASSYLGYGVTNKKFHPERVKRVERDLSRRTSIYEVVLGEAPLTEALVPARTRILQPERDDDPHADDDDHFQVIPNLHLVLGSRSMSQASSAINDPTRDADDFWLRRAVEALPKGLVDVIVVDFRGAVDTLEISYLAGLDYVIGCIRPDPKADDTLTSLQTFIERGQRKFEFAGGCAAMEYVLFNGYVTNRGKFYTDKWDQTLEFYGKRALPYIHDSVQFLEAMEHQEPVLYYCGEHSQQAEDFRKVVKKLPL
ncbi:ParA family protein [Streptomyces sp. Ac-502]|uniref:ParA family protein n=1 Tax=Streptomyces sp. Ac-502 TaxID=3342801 RepID=UPI0038621F8E